MWKRHKCPHTDEGRHTILSLYNGTLFSSEWSINVCSKKPVAKNDLLDDYDNIEYRRLHII